MRRGRETYHELLHDVRDHDRGLVACRVVQLRREERGRGECPQHDGLREDTEDAGDLPARSRTERGVPDRLPEVVGDECGGEYVEAEEDAHKAGVGRVDAIRVIRVDEVGEDTETWLECQRLRERKRKGDVPVNRP
jgi:hypothetical protein